MNFPIKLDLKKNASVKTLDTKTFFKRRLVYSKCWKGGGEKTINIYIIVGSRIEIIFYKTRLQIVSISTINKYGNDV